MYIYMCVYPLHQFNPVFFHVIYLLYQISAPAFNPWQGAKEGAKGHPQAKDVIPADLRSWGTEWITDGSRTMR